MNIKKTENILNKQIAVRFKYEKNIFTQYCNCCKMKLNIEQFVYNLYTLYGLQIVEIISCLSFCLGCGNKLIERIGKENA